MRRLLTFVSAFTAALIWTLCWMPLDADIPRREIGATFLRCDHCKERDAWLICGTCGGAWCPECDVVHERHVAGSERSV